LPAVLVAPGEEPGATWQVVAQGVDHGGWRPPAGDDEGGAALPLSNVTHQRQDTLDQGMVEAEGAGRATEEHGHPGSRQVGKAWRPKPFLGLDALRIDAHQGQADRHDGGQGRQELLAARNDQIIGQDRARGLADEDDPGPALVLLLDPECRRGGPAADGQDEVGPGRLEPVGLLGIENVEGRANLGLGEGPFGPGDDVAAQDRPGQPLRDDLDLAVVTGLVAEDEPGAGPGVHEASAAAGAGVFGTGPAGV
jgi:hypothetical protein